MTISNAMNISFLQPRFSVLKMYTQRLNYQVFPMKTSEAFQVWTKCVENKWQSTSDWIKTWLYTKKSHRILFHILCDLG